MIQIKTPRLIEASKSRVQAELALSTIDWKALPQLFAHLGSTMSPEHAAVVVNTTFEISSIVATRNALARIGDQHLRNPFKKIVSGVCAEIVGWTGSWLDLTDIISRIES